MKAIVLSALALLLIVAALRASAAEPELMAAVSVMGYGYKVRVTVNDTDIGVRGGQSESRRLFNKGHSLKEKASPSLRERSFPLVQGANELRVEYSKIDPKSDDSLEIVVEAEGYPQPLLRIVNRRKASDRLTLNVVIDAQAPPDFKPVIIDDSR